MISKFLVGQEVSGYTSKNHVFEGFVFKNKEGRKVVSLIFHNNFVKSHSLFLVLDGVTENSLKRIRIGMKEDI